MKKILDFIEWSIHNKFPTSLSRLWTLNLSLQRCNPCLIGAWENFANMTSDQISNPG